MEISGKTRLLGLIGSPVEHSKSPAMYNYCFEKWNLDYKYLAFDVPRERMGEAIQAFRTFHMKGANITMPCKQEVLQYLDEVTPAAKLVGACNTIVDHDGVLTGYITDGEGYVENLRQEGVSIKGKKITLLGAGGVSSAIQAQALLDGAREIAVFNQRDAFWEQAEKKVAEYQAAFPQQKITLHNLGDAEDLAEEIRTSDILSNATRVGMHPLEEVSLIADQSLFREGLVVTDVVYEPEETKLLREAKAAGCKVVNGLGMLIYQGAAAAKLYTGLDMPVEEVKRKFFTNEDRKEGKT